MPVGIYKRTEEYLKKLKEQGFQKHSKAWNKGKPLGFIPKNAWRKGRIPWNKGKKLPPLSLKHRLKMSESHKRIRYKSHLWKGGITPLRFRITQLIEYKDWRKKVFHRDNYTCRDCEQKGGRLMAHHKKEFSLLLQEFLNEYNQFSPIEDKETLIRLAITYKPFWDTDNGKTLCKKCHKETDSYLNRWSEKIVSSRSL